MTDDVQDEVLEQATRLNEVATDPRIRPVLDRLQVRILEDVAQLVTELQALGVEDDDIDRLVEMELLIASKFKRELGAGVEAAFRE